MERLRREHRVEEEETLKELAEAAKAFMQDIRENREEERRLTSAVL